MANSQASDKEIAQHIDSIRADIAELAQTVGQLATDTAGIQSAISKKVTNAARHVAATGEHFVADAAEMGSDVVHAAAKGASNAVSTLEDQVTRNPMTAVIAALGIGVAVGLMTRR